MEAKQKARSIQPIPNEVDILHTKSMEIPHSLKIRRFIGRTFIQKQWCLLFPGSTGHTHTHNFNRVGMRRWLVVIVHPCMTTWQYAYTTVSSVVQLLVMSHWTVVLIKCPVHLCSGYCHGIAMPKKMNYLQNKAIFTHNSNALWCTQLRLTALCSTYGWL